MTHFDFAIIGAGIAGASMAHQLAKSGSVLILEAEDTPGYHSTGRSVAFWNESYGGPAVQPLTTASYDFLAKPPADFATHTFLLKRGALHIGKEEHESHAERLLQDFRDSTVNFSALSSQQIKEFLPGIKEEWTTALWEEGCYDIDVARLHAAYLASARRLGAELRCNAALEKAAWQNGRWNIFAAGHSYTADMVVNAAGSWADHVASLCGVKAMDIRPLRRTVVQLVLERQMAADQPLVVGLDGSFYFKPEPGGRIWLSPHDEIPSAPCDAAPEEIDVALAIERFGALVDWKIKKLEHKWAGLRNFAPDRKHVIGRDPANDQFFWMAGQGGYGIQTAPAAAQLATSLILESAEMPENIDPASYSPARF